MKLNASAPSNIALIKYMGKVDNIDNRPANSSLSFTLDALRTQVEIELDPSLQADIWEPLIVPGSTTLALSEKGKAKFLKHLSRIRQEIGDNSPKMKNSFFRVRSSNNFPSDCGIASSASSFAALTRASYQMARALDDNFEMPTSVEQAEMSRRGSGSSCRSFFGPWALWAKEGVRPLELPVESLVHQLVVVDDGKKEVSSSEAHERCLTSLLFAQRPQRAEARLAELMAAFRTKDWQRIYQVTWAEFWDMHVLFETSLPAFGYLSSGSLKCLAGVREIWTNEKDGPVVTMDAGANVHLLWRQDQLDRARKYADELSSWHPVYMTEGETLKKYGAKA